ncbi:lysis protein [Enterobacter cancerogenus]|uniref:Lysis protein n=1 Tax=Enterobacter cancerogenus TaxID=69218 RepID=A0AB38P9X8_9ENTR|nr:lysis protein [Enterobacter cancerogenus]TKK23425.1 lysis protein [Enterobacter cancerogenus]
MNKYLIAVLAVAVLSLGWVADHYHDKAVSWRTANRQAQASLNRLAATVTDMQVRQKQLAELDTKQTRELTDAKNHIDDLQRDVVAGRMQLQLHARCPANVPAGKTAGTSGVGDDATARLTADAERNYWRLRSGISTITNQVTYLQDYIDRICLK